MSTIIHDSPNGDGNLTRFAGPAGTGAHYQITDIGGDFISLPEKAMDDLVAAYVGARDTAFLIRLINEHSGADSKEHLDRVLGEEG